ncbi:MAG: hypothetical protein AB8B61_08635 [Cyclobacteriaceae bacterium]
MKLSNQQIFKVVFVLFTIAMIGVGVYIMKKTTPPWEKRGETINKYKVR